MKAWRLHEPGGPGAFVLEDLPTPEPEPGRVLIKVRAFGLNRSEWFTRIGESPTVKLPRVLGIECVGTVVSAPGGELEKGQRVAAMMGGMGREFDGSYAEYTSVPAANVFPLETELPWDVVGALPEMLQTCHGSLHTGLGVE
ncbi:MAG: NADPH:quinone reductase, partial [Myxococcales bacterium]